MGVGQLRDLEHFVEILDSLDAIVWEADASTFEFTYVSDGATRILGYPVEEWIGNPGFWESLIHPIDRDDTVAFCSAAVRESRDHRFEYRALAADGRVVWLDDVVRVVTDPDGETRLLRGVMTDVTARKAAEAERARAVEALRESEQRFRAQYEGLPHPAYTWRAVDDDFILEGINPAASQFTRGNLDALVGSRLSSENFADRPDIAMDIRECFRRRARVERQIVFSRFIDKERHILTSYVFIPPDRVIAHGVDITDQVEARARLAESEERYRLLAELTSDYAWSVAREDNGDFVFEWVTDAIEQVHGRRPDEVVGSRWLDVVHPDDRDAYHETLRELLAGKHVEVELRILRPDGEVRWISGVARRADSSDGKVRIVGSSCDITERKRAEEELEASERRFRAVFDHAPLGISTVDLDGRLVLFNQALVDMLGYSPEQLRRMRFVDFSHPEDGQENLRLYQELQHGNRDSYTMEKRYITADGTMRWGQLVASLIRDEEGEPICGIAIVQDVTERKEAEGERERLQQQLLQSQKMDAIGRLAGSVAHDFNNILGAILTYAEFIRENPRDAEVVAKDAAEIMAAAERAATLTRQLLVFSRRETPQVVMLDLGMIVTDHSRMLRRMLGATIELVVEITPDVSAIVADRIQMEQVLLNLAVNARDAMPSGGALTISVTAADDGRVRLAVTDEGIGMAPEVQARAFEPFYTTKDPAHGTGLGLATVYGIVEALGGEIRLHSVEDDGTEVEILLPPADDVAIDRVSSDVLPDVAPPTVSILVVEDDDQLRNIIKRMLEREGHEVSVAADAGQALRLAHGVDLVITDVVMPGTSGVELGRELRRRRPETAIVYISGYPRDVVEQDGDLDGPLVEKPFTIADLRAGIADAFATR